MNHCRIREEVDAVMGTRTHITWEDVNRFNYIHKVPTNLDNCSVVADQKFDQRNADCQESGILNLYDQRVNLEQRKKKRKMWVLREFMTVRSLGTVHRESCLEAMESVSDMRPGHRRTHCPVDYK